MLFKKSVRTSKRTQHFTITKIKWLTVFKEIIAIYSDIIQDPLLPISYAGSTYSLHSALKDQK